jgi:hypothetical protein
MAAQSSVSRYHRVPNAPYHELPGSDDVPLVQRLVSMQSLEAEGSKIEGAIGTMENEFREASADRRRLLHSVSAEAVGEIEVG